MNYQNLVAKFRELAKDFLRMLMINDLKDALLEKELYIKSKMNKIDEYNKIIQRAEFRISEIKENDPDKETKEKDILETIKDIKEEIENENKMIEKQNEKKEFIQDKMKEVEDGTYKVSKEQLSIKSQELINEFIKNQAREVKLNEETSDR